MRHQDEAAALEPREAILEPRVDFIGRFDTRDPAGPLCGWPGCRILVRFDGTALSVRLEELTESWMKGGPSEWDVSVDGERQPKIVMAEGKKQYAIASGLARGIHIVELYKRSEAQNGSTRFLGYELGDGKLLAPPPRRARRLEIVGDSSAAGFGVEGVGHGPACPGVNYAAKWQNFRKSFGARLGEGLAAEVYATVYSGKGLVKNIWRPDEDTMPVIFPRALPTDPRSSWDFASWVPHVVVIMIGGNDFAIGQPSDDGPTPLSEFTDAYERFVATIREKYPEAWLFLATSASVTDKQPPERHARSNIRAAIDEVIVRRDRAGDVRVRAWTPPIAAPSELEGCEGHGTPELHQRLADDLAPIVRERVGW